MPDQLAVQLCQPNNFFYKPVLRNFNVHYFVFLLQIVLIFVHYTESFIIHFVYEIFKVSHVVIKI